MEYLINNSDPPLAPDLASEAERLIKMVLFQSSPDAKAGCNFKHFVPGYDIKTPPPIRPANKLAGGAGRIKAVFEMSLIEVGQYPSVYESVHEISNFGEVILDTVRNVE